MKRMYGVLAIFFIIIFWAGALIAQQAFRPVDNQTDLMQKRLQMREEMHKRMIDKLLLGVGPDKDMFKDMEKFMDEVMSDSFTGFDSFTQSPIENFGMEWQETTKGRTLVITPKTPEQQLDINVNNGLVIIKGKLEQKSPNGISVSNFSNSFNVPEDCDPSKVKMDQKDGKILVQFPYHKANKLKTIPKAEPELKPIGPSDNDVQI